MKEKTYKYVCMSCPHQTRKHIATEYGLRMHQRNVHGIRLKLKRRK